jgi:hypothetical protein
MTKRRGRPPLDPDDPSVPVMFRVPSKQYDATFRNARDARETVSDYVRRAVQSANQARAVTPNDVTRKIGPR